MTLLTPHLDQVLQRWVIQILVLLAWVSLLHSILKNLGQLLCSNIPIVVLIKVEKGLPDIIVIDLQFQFQVFLQFQHFLHHQVVFAGTATNLLRRDRSNCIISIYGTALFLICWWKHRFRNISRFLILLRGGRCQQITLTPGTTEGTLLSDCEVFLVGINMVLFFELSVSLIEILSELIDAHLLLVTCERVVFHEVFQFYFCKWCWEEQGVLIYVFCF